MNIPCLHVVTDLCNPHHPRFALLPPRGGGQCVAICDWPKGATDNVRSLRRRGSVFEQEKTEGPGLAMVRYATGQRPGA
ncbi:hypothetical protein FGW20_02715 [Methanoculleus sp. FWC-SCC3]|uniref:Uncharacterized protein n=1 Tax=Methanoculleus methanifontis TaxID=2584086 RepID=A0ABT8LYX3_9EURY|nr:hypothetical protein [Methanoculleus sp. FWC-SCC3]MDN7011974.1 hypothetical protein [Methanoculleus sp. FWC-SCC3]